MKREDFDKLLSINSLKEFNEEVLSLLKQGKCFKEILGCDQEELYQEYLYAMERFTCKEYPAALKIFTRLALLDPQVKEYWVALGTTQSRLGETEKALISLSMASIIDPKDPDPYYRAALCYLSLQKEEDGKKSLQLALTHARQDSSFRSIELKAEEWLKKIRERRAYG